MLGRLFVALICVGLFSLGVGFISGGFFSHKYGIHLTAGAYNPFVGAGLIAVAAVVLYLSVVRSR